MATAPTLTALVRPDPAAVAARAADLVVAAYEEAIASSDRFSLALSGGGTPGPTYRLLAEPPRRERIDWSRVEIFFADDRLVPPDDPGSNYRLARETLLGRVPLPAEQVHRIHGELPPAEAVARADAEFRALLGDPPRLSAAILGMGDDGHVASLFPGSPALAESARFIVAAPGPPPWPNRATMTFPALLSARHAIFIVVGAAKAERIAEVFAAAARGDGSGPPAARIRPATWVLDEAAASRLPGAAR